MNIIIRNFNHKNNNIGDIGDRTRGLSLAKRA